MRTSFCIEAMRLRSTCQQATENIVRIREAKKRAVIEDICQKLRNSHWSRHPWDHFFTRSKLGSAFLASRYNVEKMLADKDYRNEIFRSECGHFDLFEWDLTYLYASGSEELCARLLSACAIAKDITITVEDWHTVYSWSKCV